MATKEMIGLQTQQYVKHFQSNSEIYRRYHAIVNHTNNYYQQLSELGLLNNCQNALSIGAGDGLLELQLMQKHKIQIGYIDPAQDFYSSFQKNIHSLNIQNYVTEFFTDIFENYHSDYRYDLTLAVHSWYPFGESQEMLNKAISTLKPDGKLFITLASETSPAYKIGALCGGSIEKHLSSEQLLGGIIRANYKCEYIVNHNYLPLTKFVINNELTVEGKDFVSFLGAKQWNLHSPAIYKQIINEFNESASSDYIDLPSGCIIIQKNKI